MKRLQLDALRACALSFALPSLLGLSASLASAQTPLPSDGEFDYQIGGSYAPAAGVRIVSRDVSNGASKSDGIYDICYLNALQTQGSETERWKEEHPELLLKDEDGNFVHDPDSRWADEILFDVRTPEQRQALIAVQKEWIGKCANGFDAIEPDNLDSYERAPDGLLSAQDVAEYMKLFVQEAHRQKLAVAQKNVVDWDAGFDFALIEECQLWDQCDEVIDRYGPDRVIEIEYVYEDDFEEDGVSIPAGSREHFDEACKARGDRIRIVLRNDDVRPQSDDGWVFDAC